MDWLGIHFEEKLYYDGNHCPAQVLRNCVHPLLGEHIFNAGVRSFRNEISTLPGEQAALNF